MKLYVRAILTITVIAAFNLVRHLGGGSGTLDYGGQSFKTAKRYRSYEDYKDDPNNLDTNELIRIEKLMSEASLPSSFNSRKDFINAMFKLKFPGYGLGGIGEEA